MFWLDVLNFEDMTHGLEGTSMDINFTLYRLIIQRDQQLQPCTQCSLHTAMPAQFFESVTLLHHFSGALRVLVFQQSRKKVV